MDIAPFRSRPESGPVGLYRLVSDNRRGSADSLVTVALAEASLVRVDLVDPIGYERSASELGILTRRFSLFQLVSAIRKKNWNGEAENRRFQLRGTDALQPWQTANELPNGRAA